jgi:hypothetical protein
VIKVCLEECIERRRLAEECAKLDPVEKHQLAEEGMTGEIETWPEIVSLSEIIDG